jgi:hypothetical protein
VLEYGRLLSILSLLPSKEEADYVLLFLQSNERKALALRAKYEKLIRELEMEKGHLGRG